jgi:peptidyl-prolyl cis-trans isomerase B (cyclophilin B)
VTKDDRLKRERLRHFEARQVMNKAARARKKRDQFVWTGAAIASVVLASLGLFAYDTIGPGAPPKVPDSALSEYRTWSGEITLSDLALEVSLDGDNAPQAVSNFVALSQKGFYNDTVCHRLTTDAIFVLQCGDPQGDGRGNAGYSFGPIENSPEGDLYPAGTIAMARSANNAESHGSQFFIVYQDSVIPSDAVGGYTIFGSITSPLEPFIDAFVAPGTADGSSDGPPNARAQIQSITIR